MSKTKHRRLVQNRVFILFLGSIVLLALLAVRVGYLQIVQGEELQKQAIEQQTRDRIINSKRGAILDRKGKQLAVSATVETVTASPAEISKNKDVISPEKVAEGLSEILEMDYQKIYDKITKNSLYEIIKRKIEKEEADKVRNFISENKVLGIYLDADTKRFYPYGSLASHVIGFTGMDNQGLEGIESVFDKYLKGSPGRIISAKNAAGTDMLMKYEKLVDPQDGLNVVLTIDETIQRFVENHLETAFIENKLLEGAASIVLDPKTGEILAMSTMPSYDLNNPFYIQSDELREEIEKLVGEEKQKRQQQVWQKMWRNKAVVDSYEPGSTFKVFTSAMALEENAVKLDDRFYCSGSVQVATHRIRCWKHGGHGSQTFVEGVQNSCNPVFIDIGARVGTTRFMDYFAGFGFTQTTGIELPGETKGIYHNRQHFNEVELATYSFGQGFQITPLQMIAAVGAVANGGKLMKPHLVKQLTDKEGNIVVEYESEFVRQVVSKETSEALTGILETVVSHGTGSGAYIKGFRVGGKTGTSEKTPRGNNKYIASFVGFAPADDPQVVCIVILDEPSTGLYYGGQIASPVVRNILEDTLSYLGVEPAYTPEEKATLETSVPNVLGKTAKEAKNILQNNNLKYRIEGEGESIISQIPKAGIKVNQQSTITLYTEEDMAVTKTIVPNVLNQTVIGASNLISQANLNIKIIGAGSVLSRGGVVSYKQDPPAGASVDIGSVVTVEFRRVEAGE
ncbi:MAG: stage V sporulation protein D [Eubacteriales bacterium]|jgi:stage V sporulation protein D (sporulation-specific penicillin-binding protein)|nr:stage V sporulation protein D [Eubacteriales bacterium]